MELKVWVDGILRVVCGLSEDTTCQQVVIALAQAIGQTGRYVLVRKLHDKERQLLADERPLEALAKLGQLSSQVQFILRRTGPSGPSAPSGGSRTNSGPPPPPDRTTSLAPLPPPKNPPAETPKNREPKKAHTFNLGPSTGPRIPPKHFKKPQRDSPEAIGASAAPSLPPPPPPHSKSPASSPVPPPVSSSPALPSKEEVFRQVLQQQAELRALTEKLDSVKQEVWEWEQAPPPVLPPHLLEELHQLEELVRQNKAELAHTDHWEVELAAEEEREDAMHREAEQLRRLLTEHVHGLADSDAQVGRLEQELQKLQQNGLSQPDITQKSLETVRLELGRRHKQEAELASSLSDMDQELETADRMLQAKIQELDELNKELRQCNLQQFIQQTGVPPNMSSQTDLQAETELLHVSQLVETDTDTDLDSEDSGLFSSGSQPRLTAREILGAPRSLNKPLVLATRDLPWQ